MNDAKPVGGPAFPQPAQAHFKEGMTLRDYFAAKALASACQDNSPNEAAQLAYAYADAMLRERAK